LRSVDGRSPRANQATSVTSSSSGVADLDQPADESPPAAGAAGVPDQQQPAVVVERQDRHGRQQE
jgi:hypothetical protein